MTRDEIEKQVASVEEALKSTYGFRRGDLARLLRRTGRRLPRARRRDGARLLEARLLAGHPKTERQIDLRAVTRSAQNIKDFLATQNPAQERMTQFLRILASVAFVVLLTVGVAIWVAYDRGLI